MEKEDKTLVDLTEQFNIEENDNEIDLDYELLLGNLDLSEISFEGSSITK